VRGWPNREAETPAPLVVGGGTTWNNRRLIIFTEWEDTARLESGCAGAARHRPHRRSHRHLYRRDRTGSPRGGEGRLHGEAGFDAAGRGGDACISVHSTSRSACPRGGRGARSRRLPLSKCGAKVEDRAPDSSRRVHDLPSPQSTTAVKPAGHRFLHKGQEWRFHCQIPHTVI
jgi:hypothetical protein